MTEPGTFKSIQRFVFLGKFGEEVHMIDAIDIHGKAWFKRITPYGESQWLDHPLLPAHDNENETN